MVGSLYYQSTYSILQSTLHLEIIFKHAKKEGLSLVGITDDNNLHSLYKRLLVSKKYGIPVILGFLKTFEIESYPVDLLIYAKDDEQLKTLIKLNSYTALNHKIQINDVLGLLNQLVVILPSTQRFIYENIHQNHIISDMISYFKKHIKGFYIGISGASDFEKIELMPWMVKCANTYQIDILPTHLFTYETSAHKATYEIVGTIKDSVFKPLDVPMHLIGQKELKEQYRDYPEVFDNLKKIFGQTSYSYLDQKQALPEYPTKDNVDSQTFLNALAHAGLKRRLQISGISDIKLYQERLNHELDIIHQMGYNDYFLIVYDFVRFAKTNDILVGPGRGSAAGSLVSYCLGITDVNPITYDLLFERFLNIDRQSMPDIDLDFPDVKRDLVIEYVKNKYGANHVVTMTTFTNLTTKTSMRDIARQMGLSQSRINAIIASHAKGILDETDREAKKLIEIAQTIEGIPRQTGTHPAGIILSKNDLTTQIPLTAGPKDVYQSQLEASDLEALGFLKIDFLGLKNLTMIEDILALEHNKFKVSDIPLNDKKTYELLSKADVEGVFQLESPGMKNTLRKLQPSQFDDIVAILALYRPGPMQFIDDYIKRRHGKPYERLDPDIDDILKSTYGIIVYQEQIMKILQVYAGYTLSEADIIRRAISKKDRDIIDQEKKRFLDRALSLKRTKSTAEKIYTHIEKFADYGFNKSHSVSYAYISYYMAYLKTHYYPSFISVLMTQNTSNTNYLKTLIDDALQKNIVVFPPDINKSDVTFKPNQQGILAPLSMIKGFGFNNVEKIIELRVFKSFDDFKEKVKGIFNERQIESLIYAGALDGFGLNKATLLENNNLSQTGFENFLKDYQEVQLEELPFSQLKQNELEVLGMNLLYTKDQTLTKLQTQYKIRPMNLNDYHIKTIGVIESIKVIQTKNGQEMAFMILNNGMKLDLTLFPNTYKVYKGLLDANYIYIEANKDTKQDAVNKYIINKIKKVKE